MSEQARHPEDQVLAVQILLRLDRDADIVEPVHDLVDKLAAMMAYKRFVSALRGIPEADKSRTSISVRRGRRRTTPPL